MTHSSVARPAVCLLAFALLAACGEMRERTSPVPAETSASRGEGTTPSAARTPAVRSTKALDLRALPTVDAIIGTLAGKRVVFIGESHPRYDHHLTQLEIIQRLYAIDPNLAIGMEFFQQPFQGAVDAYIAGRLSEKEFLQQTEYYERWRFDFRLYAPILRFAREHRIPVIALNLPAEITKQVGRGGLESLSPEQKAQVPREIDRSNEAYLERLRKVFEQHPKVEGREFEHFSDVQLLWDEGMAERASRYLEEHPGQRLVVLAGNGHLEFGSGIPDRLKRRVPVEAAIVLNGPLGSLEEGIADFVLLPRELQLPPAGRLGILLDESAQGIRVEAFLDESPAREAGVEARDWIRVIDGTKIRTTADVKIALWDRQPGDTVRLELDRDESERGGKPVEVMVTLR